MDDIARRRLQEGVENLIQVAPELARLMWTWKVELTAKGFTDDEAIRLTDGFMKSLLETASKAQGTDGRSQ